MEIRNVIRWETDCCGYLFNTGNTDETPTENEPTTIKVYGKGVYLAGSCPGCGSEHVEITKIS